MYTIPKMDRRRKYYLVLDCETATLPYASNFTDENQKRKIAIGKPLIYDLGWQVVDRQGRVYSKKSFLITEIFSVPSVFNTAYYAEKRPLYIEKLNRGEITLTDWKTATAELEKDMAYCSSVGAFNSMFDYKKAIPFTELYIEKLYSDDFYRWEREQNSYCDQLLKTYIGSGKKEFDENNFVFRGRTYPLFDIWGLACKHILDCDEYRQMCIDHEWETASGKFFKSSAETTYRFLLGNQEFVESHTAIEDAIIETEILARIMKKKASNLTIGIIYFPFKLLGTVEQFEYKKAYGSPF